MKKLRFSRKAGRDLKVIYKYIAQDNVTAADRVLEEIQQACGHILELPKLGRARPDAGQNLRYFPVSDYNIFYQIKGSSVIIVRVIHGKRDIRRALNYE
ncbi:MAG: type II toxin-antitoxin system RelE/ParE family toxin [Candidatus Hydrogenedentes bacterium]|nr:type II toxin-antitoxin system RelE/ParE family toxin [Candidatus Hydrogenedentota bacterium]